MKKTSLLWVGPFLLFSIAAIILCQPSAPAQSFDEPKGTLQPIPTQTLTSTPLPTPSPTPNPATIGSFGPQGYFRIASPENLTYITNNLTLIIRGEAINQPLTMSYCVDEQRPVAISVAVQQEHDWDVFVGGIHASVALPSLTSGVHSITVYGTLCGVSAESTVHFTIR
jgi:hypothetical protein